jgi:hypothetical protein
VPHTGWRYCTRDVVFSVYDNNHRRWKHSAVQKARKDSHIPNNSIRMRLFETLASLPPIICTGWRPRYLDGSADLIENLTTNEKRMPYTHRVLAYCKNHTQRRQYCLRKKCTNGLPTSLSQPIVPINSTVFGGQNSASVVQPHLLVLGFSKSFYPKLCHGVL